MKYDIVIIGSGLGGLECGLILSKEGLNVCVLEQNSKVGGNLQSFTRDGCIFDTGMHYIGSMDEGQYLHKYFKYFGIADKLILKRLDTDGFDTLTFDDDDTEYKLSQGYDNFSSRLLQHFPEEKKAIDQYTSRIRAVTDDFPLYDPSGTGSYHIPLPTLETCALGFLSGLSNNERLKNVLAGGLSLYPGHAGKTPLYVHACMRDSLINSCWRPVDGSQQIADLLVAGIKSYGGTILTSHRVNEIIVENEEARAVLLDNGETIYGDNFISNAHPITSLKMIREGKIRKIYRKRITSLDNTWGAFSLYAVLKKDTFPYLNKNYFHYSADGILNASHDEKRWPDNYYFYTPATSNTGRFAESIMLMADMKFEEVSPWLGTKINRRGEEYEAFKAGKAEKLLTALEKRLPGIRANIEKVYTSTPLTFHDYTGTDEGSAYGIMKNCHDPLRSIILPRTKINNLFFTGQNMNLHGILGVTASAVITCSEIVGLQYLTKKIANG